MSLRSLYKMHFFSRGAGINFIVNWLVNPRFGEDFFCPKFLQLKYNQQYITNILWQD